MKSDIYRKEIIVEEVHLDDLNHVNNVVYLEWAQDVARSHWDSKSNSDFDARYYWVVMNHFIEYKLQAIKDDHLVVTTFVESNLGVRSTRNVQFSKEGKLVVEVKSQWCLINAKTNRPSRIPEEVNEMFFK